MSFSEILESLNFTNLVWQIIAPLIFMLVDIITGVIQAVINKNLDSQKMREGLLRKLGLILIIILGFIIRYAFNIPIISKAIVIYILLMETLSILENLKKAGIDFGKFGELLKVKADEPTVNLVLKDDENKESEVK